MNPDLTDIT